MECKMVYHVDDFSWGDYKVGIMFQKAEGFFLLVTCSHNYHVDIYCFISQFLMLFHSALQSLMESDQVTVRVQKHKCEVNGLGQSTTALF